MGVDTWLIWVGGLLSKVSGQGLCALMDTRQSAVSQNYRKPHHWLSCSLADGRLQRGRYPFCFLWSRCSAGPHKQLVRGTLSHCCPKCRSTGVQA